MSQFEKQGHVVGVNGNMVTVSFDTKVRQNEVAYVVVGDRRLKSEVIRVRGSQADIQVYEDTSGVTVGDQVEFTDQLLSVSLGPGLLTQVFDGLQNPLPRIAEEAGFFLQRGMYFDPLEREEEWDWTPKLEVGAQVQAGDAIGSVPEHIFDHQIMVPFDWHGTWELTWIAEAGKLPLTEVVAKASNGMEECEIYMVQDWPVRKPINAYQEKLLPTEPLVTQQRIVDTFFPVAKGGTFCSPGPFGAGKTVLQHLLSQHSQADVVIVAACGERAGEVVEVLREYPELDDPRTGKKLIDRTIIICNTSSMPVAAREASIYTAVTLGEYYRQMGLNVFLLADSTSRWAQALREVSGRLEEIPGEEAFPAYLESLIAGFYERAGLTRLNDSSTGSVTIGGAVSPAGGNFEEPVTQATLKVVGGFLGLSRDRANARRFPAIDPLESYSQYSSFIDSETVKKAQNVLQQGNEIDQMMKVVGEEGTSVDDFVTYLKGEFLDSVYLQQDAFDEVDAANSEERQKYTFNKVNEVLETDFTFEDKEDARHYFMRLRQTFVDWNFTAWDSEDFREQEKQIDSMLAEKASNKSGQTAAS